MNCGGSVRTPAAKSSQDLGKLVTKLENSGQRVLLLLDHFDALLDNPDIDPKFDARFHDHLNSSQESPTHGVGVRHRRTA
ncbi:MAG: hypothetical protein V9G98_03080 [Candidatus Competibacter sp.]